MPIVAVFADDCPSIAIVVQSTSPSIEHREPVYPFVQMQEHVDPLEMLTPPFSHGVDFLHVEAELCWGTAIRKMGRRIARVIMITSATQRVINSHRGIPQQRWEQPSLSPRPWSESELMVSTLCNVDRLKNVGHDERSRRGGDGKDARGSWRTAELRWRSATRYY